jgi:hypothetical protein
MSHRPLLAALALACAGSAQAQFSDAFDPFFGAPQTAQYDSDLPSATVLRADGPAYLIGITRTLEINPLLGQPGFATMAMSRGASASYDFLFISARDQPLSATLSYGLDRPMNLDWSSVSALVLNYDFAMAHKLTVYAFTQAPEPGDNPLGSALSVDVGDRFQSAVVLPLAAFRQNGAAPVRWADLDRLSFAFSDETGNSIILSSISLVTTPVPEPAAWVLLAGGLSLLTARRVRSKAK